MWPPVLAFHLRAWEEGITYPTTTSLDVPDRKPESELSVPNYVYYALKERDK
jgi:hypothetical protein